jgi:hypothetical protein
LSAFGKGIGVGVPLRGRGRSMNWVEAKSSIAGLRLVGEEVQTSGHRDGEQPHHGEEEGEPVAPASEGLAFRALVPVGAEVARAHGAAFSSRSTRSMGHFVRSWALRAATSASLAFSSMKGQDAGLTGNWESVAIEGGVERPVRA